MTAVISLEASTNATFCSPPISVAPLAAAGVDIAGAVLRLQLAADDDRRAFEFCSAPGADGVILYDATAQTLTLAASLAAIHAWSPAGGSSVGDLRLEWGAPEPVRSAVVLLVRLDLTVGETTLATDPVSQTEISTAVVTARIKGRSGLSVVPADMAQIAASAAASAAQAEAAAYALMFPTTLTLDLNSPGDSLLFFF